MKCSNCGRELNDGDKFCMGCGTKVESVVKPEKTKKEKSATEPVTVDQVAVNPVAVDPVEKPVEQVPVYAYQYPQYQPPKKGKGLIITIIIMAVIILAGLIFGLWYFVLRGDDSKDNNISNNSNNTNLVDNNNVNTNTNINTNTNNSTLPSHSTTDYLPTANSSAFKYKAAFTERNKLLLFTKNETSKTYDLDIEVEFYDASGKLVGSDNEYVIGIAPGQEAVVQMYSTPEEFDSYKVYIDEKESYYVSAYKDLTITSNDNKKTNEIVIQVKNNSSKTISSVEVGVVFYKNNKVVGFDYDFDTKVNTGRSANLSVYYPYDNNYKDIDFDDFEVYINEAYYYE